MKTETTPEQLKADLRQFTGSEQIFRNWMGVHYTEGCQYLADTAGAHWLLDAISSHLVTKKALRAQPFLVVFLRKVKGKSSAMLTFHTDWSENDPKKFPPIARQRIEYTDFPLDSIKLYIEGRPRVIMLPSER